MHWKIEQGNMLVLCSLPIPLIEVSRIALVISLPSGKVQVPKLIDVNGN
jgi:hypothetical protein